MWHSLDCAVLAWLLRWIRIGRCYFSLLGAYVVMLDLPPLDTAGGITTEETLDIFETDDHLDNIDNFSLPSLELVGPEVDDGWNLLPTGDAVDACDELEVQDNSWRDAGFDSLGNQDNSWYDAGLEASESFRKADIASKCVSVEAAPGIVGKNTDKSYGKSCSELSHAVFDVSLKLERTSMRISTPLKVDPFAAMNSMLDVDKFFQLPMMGRFDNMVGDSNCIAVTESRSLGVALPFQKQRLYAARMAKSDDDLRRMALRKLRNIVLFWPDDSQLGRSLRDKAGSLVGEDELQQSLSDAFSGKAIGTLTKRTGDFNRFALWQVEVNGGRPLCPSEADFYKYVTHLRSIGAGATAGSSFLQSWRFVQHTVGAGSGSDGVAESGRVRGVANDMLTKKRKLTQAPPLTSDMVWRLEDLMFSDIDERFKVICGFLLFCIYSCARFADAARAGNPTCETFGHVAIVETTTASYKTGTGARASVLLPLMALGVGLHDESWAGSWFQARARTMVALHSWMMPAISCTSDKWLDRRMTTAEGTYWLRDLLSLAGIPLDETLRFSTHSLKCTCLSWVAKAGTMTFKERLVLGHHLEEETKMAVVYSRDAIGHVMAKLLRLVRSIRDGIFDPDASRAARIAAATGMDVSQLGLSEKTPLEDELEGRLAEDERICNQADDSDGSDVGEEADLHHEILRLPEDQALTNRSSFPEVSLQRCVQHVLSGIVHMKMGDNRLLCGRKNSSNMKAVSFGEDSKHDHDFCEQCHKHLICGL